MPLIDQEDKVLNSPCKDVVKFDNAFQETLKKITKEHSNQRGVGLAAPQLGIDQRIVVIGFHPTEEELKKNPDLITIDDFVLVNPKIVWHSSDQKVEKEGCLSIAGQAFDVVRYQKIHLEYQNEKGERKKMKARGYLARVIQHEIDHLNGLTIKRFKK